MKTKNLEKFNNLPQREKKFAKTKVALLDALLKELETKPLSKIMIKDLASLAEVSEPTFFNYFDSKEHMLVYFIQIWSIQMNIMTKECENKNHSYLKTIKDIFIKSANEMSLHPQIMLEIISFQTKSIKPKLHDITKGEKWLFFPDIDGVETLDGAGLETILPPLLQKAKKSGELSKKTDTKLLFLTLSSLFFGTSLLLLKSDPKALSLAYESQLDLIFYKYYS